MRNLIIAVDDGIYKQAKVSKSHALPFLTKQVVERLRTDGKDHLDRDIDVVADMKQHMERRLKAMGIADDGSNRARQAKLAALDSYGLFKELEARGIDVSRDTGAKFFELTANTPLFPMFLATTFIETRITSGLVSELVFAEIQVDRASVDKVNLTDAADDTELRNVEIGTDLPLTDISQLGGNVRMRKYGRRLRYARETMLLSPLAVVTAFIQRISRRIASNETDEVLEVLHAGDGTDAGTAVTDTTPASDGTLTYADLIKLEMAFANGYTGNAYVADGTSFTTILGMSEYKDPQSARQVQPVNGIPSVPTPSAAGRIYRWNTGRCTQMAEEGGRVSGVDNSQAAYVCRYGDLLEEEDTIISSGKVEVAFSYLMTVIKGDPNATQSLDVKA